MFSRQRAGRSASPGLESGIHPGEFVLRRYRQRPPLTSVGSSPLVDPRFQMLDSRNPGTGRQTTDGSMRNSGNQEDGRRGSDVRSRRAEDRGQRSEDRGRTSEGETIRGRTERLRRPATGRGMGGREVRFAGGDPDPPPCFGGYATEAAIRPRGPTLPQAGDLGLGLCDLCALCGKTWIVSGSVRLGLIRAHP